jgi:hypothetical protein
MCWCIAEVLHTLHFLNICPLISFESHHILLGRSLLTTSIFGSDDDTGRTLPHDGHSDAHDECGETPILIEADNT